MAEFEGSKWIWAEDNRKNNDRVVFRRSFTVEKPPKKAPLSVWARDSFSLFVNGKPVALGIRRCAVYDIAKYLVKGENVLGFDCLRYGKAANGSVIDDDGAGLLAACPALALYSDCEFRVLRPYMQDDGEPRPSERFWGFNTYTDGGRGEIGNLFDPEFDSTLFSDAEEFSIAAQVPADVTEESTALLNNAYMGLQKVKRMDKRPDGAGVIYTVDLGGEKICYPVIELSAMGTERLEIRSDRYTTHGKWGDDNEYRGVRSVYVCRNGVQQYISPIAFNGSKLILTAPNTVAIKSVELRVVAFPAERVLDLDADERIGALIDKCDNTMRACMDGGILDNTDRDRGCDLFALSLFARSALYMYDDSVLPLIKDALLEATNGQELLVDNPRSPLCAENPIASLLFCSAYGGVAAYYDRTGDEELLEKVHGKMCAYLMQWGELQGTKLAVRKGGSADAGYNVDREVIETCLYYSAARFLLGTAFAAGDPDYAEELQRRADLIASSFESNYFNGEYYSSGKVCDERANALAVLTGLADEAHAASLVRVLSSCNNCSPAYEGFVTEALGVLGEDERAKNRLLSRYMRLTENEAYVLPETFYYNGSACSALSVSPVSAYLAGVCGLRYTGCKAVTFVPPAGDEVKFVAPLVAGTVRFVRKGDTVVIENASGEEIDVLYGEKAIRIGKGKTKF